MVLIRAILVDLDETLYDERGSVHQALERTAAHAAESIPSLDREKFMEVYLEEGNKRWEAFEEEIRAKGRSASLDAMRVREMCFAQALACSGAAPSAATEVTRYYSQLRSSLHVLFPESKRVLEKLRKHCFVVLVSNGGTAYQREKLRATGIEGLFHAIAISEEVGYSKPQRGIFEKALREVGVSAHEAVMVGDNVDKDILGAKTLGLRGVLVCRNGHRPRFHDGQPRPDAVVKTLTELPKTLTSFAGKRA